VAFSGGESGSSLSILRQRCGIVRSAALRRSAFNLLNACSIGLRWGEYFGRCLALRLGDIVIMDLPTHKGACARERAQYRGRGIGRPSPSWPGFAMMEWPHPSCCMGR